MLHHPHCWSWSCYFSFIIIIINIIIIVVILLSCYRDYYFLLNYSSRGFQDLIYLKIETLVMMVIVLVW